MISINAAIIKIITDRLRQPSVIISLASQVIALFLALGVNLDESAIMPVVTVGCSVLSTMGILSNPDTQKKGFGDDIMKCKNCGIETQHVRVRNNMVCKDCGAVAFQFAE